MKKLIRSVLMLSIASLVVLSSCEETDDADVQDVKITVSPSPSTATLNQGDVLTLTLELTGNSDNKLKKLTVTSSASSVALVSKTLSATTATEIVRDTIDFVGSITYTVVLEGEKGLPQTSIYKVTGLPTAGRITSTSNPVELFGHVNDDGGTSRFLILNEAFGPVNLDNFTANKASIDLGFYRGTSNANTLASPDASTLQSLYTGLSWTGVKKTKLAKTTVTATQFDDLSNDSLINVVASSASWNAEGIANQLVADQVIVFEKADGKRGFIKINAVAGNNSGSDPATIRFSVKIQE